MNQDILSYNQAQPEQLQQICKLLTEEFTTYLPTADCKLFHGHPVWFINGNPIVGFDAAPARVSVLFWSGQSFDEPQLASKGKFKAAGISYASTNEIALPLLRNWLEKAQSVQWDYKNIVKNKGILHLLEQ